jgi:hypothetical protein
MRHVLARRPPAAIAGLPGRVVDAPAAALLVALARGPPGGVSRRAGTRPRAVPIAPITSAAQEEDLPAVCAVADDEPERVHAPHGPDAGDGQSRPDMGRQGRRIHAPCEIWPEGPGWQDSGPSPTSAFGTNRFTSARPPSASAPSQGWPPARHPSRLPRFRAITNSTGAWRRSPRPWRRRWSQARRARRRRPVRPRGPGPR